MIDSTEAGINVSWLLYYRSQNILSDNSTNGTVSGNVPDTIFDIEFKGYSDEVQIYFRDINVSLESGGILGMDKLDTPVSGYAATYGINRTFNFTNATVRFYYNFSVGA